MTRTARRRWGRDLGSEVDGVAFGPAGPVFLHGYDPPAGGKWFDSVIPGKVGAFDRQSGELLWSSPCEVGYGRGFGAGLDAGGDLVVLGPSQGGHRITRMAAASGEALDVQPLAEFDAAWVHTDLCLCVAARRVFALSTAAMVEAWAFQREGQRYHLAARDGNRVHVSFSLQAKRLQGVLLLDAETGRYQGELLAPAQPQIHGLVADGGVMALLVEDLEAALPEELQRQMALERLLAEDPDGDGESFGEGAGDVGGGSTGGAGGILVLDPSRGPEGAPLWFRRLAGGRDELAETAIVLDSQKLYLKQGALVTVLDALTGRSLGQAAVPGLDEAVAWAVRQGAFLVAEETRVSVFELPD